MGRKSQHRKATLASMASSLILKKRINTTLAKAKALRVYVEPLITKSKEDSTHMRRTVFSYLNNKYAVSELFREVAQKIANRPGGYTRILKTGFRKGDGAEMCFIELVDYNDNMLKSTETQTKRTRRSRRGKKASDKDQQTVQPAAEEVADTDQQPTDKPAESQVDVKDTASDEKTAEKPKEAAAEKPADESKEEKKTAAKPKEGKKTVKKEEKKPENKEEDSEKKDDKK